MENKEEEKMQIDEGSVEPQVNDQEMEEEENEEMSYRLVKRRYFCHYCQKDYNKMVNALEPLRCDVCNQGFVELIQSKQHLEDIKKQHERDQENVDEEKRRANEQYRIVFDRNNIAQTHHRYDPKDTTAGNIHGEPIQADQQRRRMQQEEQKRKADEERKQQQQQRQQQRLQQEQEQRRRNPFIGLGGQNFYDDFFHSSPFFMGTINQQRRGPVQRQSSRYRDPFSQGRFLDDDQLFDQFFRPFSFGSIFEEPAMSGIQEGFLGFNPHMFATNFSQNFRSFGGYDDDLLRRVMEMTAQSRQEVKKPTQKEAVEKLPIVVISEIHCKKAEGSDKLETPTCIVCQENIDIGHKAMFLPCGHTFHPDCILPWLKDHNTCPICRFELPSESK